MAKCPHKNHDVHTSPGGPGAARGRQGDGKGRQGDGKGTCIHSPRSGVCGGKFPTPRIHSGQKAGESRWNHSSFITLKLVSLKQAPVDPGNSTKWQTSPRRPRASKSRPNDCLNPAMTKDCVFSQSPALVHVRREERPECDHKPPQAAPQALSPRPAPTYPRPPLATRRGGKVNPCRPLSTSRPRLPIFPPPGCHRASCAS